MIREKSKFMTSVSIKEEKITPSASVSPRSISISQDELQATGSSTPPRLHRNGRKSIRHVVDLTSIRSNEINYFLTDLTLARGSHPCLESATDGPAGEATNGTDRKFQAGTEQHFSHFTTNNL